eukprot:4212171-Prymnesium_polylepis.1
MIRARATARKEIRKCIDTNGHAGRHGAPSGQTGTFPLAGRWVSTGGVCGVCACIIHARGAV